MAAYRTWVPARGPGAPRLVVADTTAQPVVVSALTGRPLHGMALAPATEARVRHALGRLARTLHTSAPEQPAGTGSPAGKLQRHLKAARPHLAAYEEELIPALARTYADLPQPALVPTHGDLQDRNVSLTDAGEPRLFDFERAGFAPATRDMVQLSDTWTGRPDLRAAFLGGYGRPLSPAEELRLACASTFDAVSGIAYGSSHTDPEVTERALRTLHHLRTNRPP
ncbi:hypothetical protein SUDANB120_05485 [Streptomyces sp. enrichment culture]|uniref:phosphotransferase family protein n=1 Tax=Streptomyces sp. enrichment culture TaxID=1795815 RepID=UPI003F55D9A5